MTKHGCPCTVAPVLRSPFLAALLGAALVAPGAAAASPGDLDPEFSGDGRVTFRVPGFGNPRVGGIRVGPAGELLLSGVASTASGDGQALALVRLAADGAARRWSVAPMGSLLSEDATRAVPHGDGIAVGMFGATGSRVLRFGPDDRSDPAFGTGGVTDLPGERVQAVAVQRDDG